ncbi:aminopeptidase-like [Oscarella lobularis]|uniref:aminopeptidase-like n=1 Tax=Oscarella lobularis TaxID=121494 RepID=UPI0033135C8A
MATEISLDDLIGNAYFQTHFHVTAVREVMAETDEKIPLSGVREADGGSRYVSFEKKRAARVTKVLVITLIILALVLTAVAVPVALLASSSSTSPDKLANSVEVKNIMAHLQALNDIANNNTNSPVPSRSVLNQYNASAEYVISVLKSVGYTPYTQSFQVPVNMEYGGSFSIQTSGIPPYVRTFVQKFDFDVMRYSGNGNAQGSLKALSQDASGCNSADYSGVNLGDIVLIQYNSNCTYYDKAKLASENNASAIIFYWNEQNAGLLPSRSRVLGTNLTDFIDLPILSATYGLGRELLNLISTATVVATIETQTSVTIAWTYNVFADTAEGRDDRIVVFGSHLDSVAEGPGINDNGSGSATNLEVAVQVANQKWKPINKVRFAWWGGEELGLLGSKYYVNTLTEEGKSNHSLNLNFDMLASPNFIRQVYTINGSSFAGSDEFVCACYRVQELFEDRFRQKDALYQTGPFGGGSDYVHFMDTNIPAGALATGAGSLKTVEERELFGGFPNAALDTCYHQSCDTVSNIDQTVLGQMADAAAYTLQQVMMMDDLHAFLCNATTEIASYSELSANDNECSQA